MIVAFTQTLSPLNIGREEDPGGGRWSKELAELNDRTHS